MGPDKVKEEKVWAKLAPRDTPENPRELPLKESPSQQSEDWQEEEESKESPHSSMTTPELSSSPSSRTSSETPSPTLSTPEGRLSLLWTLSAPLKDKEEPSMDSVDEEQENTQNKINTL